MRIIILCCGLLASPVGAETLVAAKLLRAQTIISPTDVTQIAATTAGMLQHPNEAIGRELRVTVYAGRPIAATDLQKPAVIERNQIVKLIYSASGLNIETTGRALDRAGSGDFLRVLNLQSKITLTGKARSDGSVTLSKVD